MCIILAWLAFFNKCLKQKNRVWLFQVDIDHVVPLKEAPISGASFSESE